MRSWWSHCFSDYHTLLVANKFGLRIVIEFRYLICNSFFVFLSFFLLLLHFHYVHLTVVMLQFLFLSLSFSKFAKCVGVIHTCQKFVYMWFENEKKIITKKWSIAIRSRVGISMKQTQHHAVNIMHGIDVLIAFAPKPSNTRFGFVGQSFQFRSYRISIAYNLYQFSIKKLNKS